MKVEQVLNLRSVVAKRVRSWREAKGLSILEGAARLNVSEFDLAKYECGEEAIPLYVLGSMADSYGVSESDIVECILVH